MDSLRTLFNPKKWIGAWREDYQEFSAWRRWFLRLAILALVAGLGMRTVLGDWGGTLTGERTAPPPGDEARTTLVEGAPRVSEASDDDASFSAGTSAFLIRCGVSFLAAFLVAYLLRKAIKVGLFVLITIGGGLLLLNGLDVIDLPLESWADDLRAVAGKLEGKSRELMDVVKSWLPSSVSTGAGLFAGFRKS